MMMILVLYLDGETSASTTVLGAEFLQHHCSNVRAVPVPLFRDAKAPTRAGGRTPRTPGRGGGLTYAQEPHVTHENFFSSFLMFSKYL